MKIKKELFEKLFQKREDSKEENPKKMEFQKKTDQNEVRMPRKIHVVAIISVISGIILLFVGTTVYFYRQYKKAVAGQIAVQNATQSANPASEEDSAKKDLQSVLAAVGKIMELPAGEDPILATVTDVEKVKTQKFFANAQNGDKVLIYANKKKAILYRPSTGKIIDVSAVSSLGGDSSSAQAGQDASAQSTQAAVQDQSQQTPSPPASDQQVSPVNVAIFNGTKIKGLATTLAGELSSMPEITVVSKTNAVGDYSDNIVVDLNGSHSEEAQKIAQTLSGSVGTLPDGEKRPDNADILVIGGKE